MAEQGFPKQARLLVPGDFQPVFSRPDVRVSSRYVLLLARFTKRPGPRLGVVVGRKNVKSAVQRNRIKRIVRESFRLRKAEFGTIDIVVLARKGLDRFDNSDIHAQLGSLFDELCGRLPGEE